MTKAPYKLLFNGGVTATRLWSAVEVLRAVDDTLREEQKELDGRDRSVAVHGNRLIAHAVFKTLSQDVLDDHTASFDNPRGQAPDLTRRALAEARAIVERDYPNNYLASLFKNASRCRDVIDKLPDLAAEATAA